MHFHYVLPASALLEIGLTSFVPTLDFLATPVTVMSKIFGRGITDPLTSIVTKAIEKTIYFRGVTRHTGSLQVTHIHYRISVYIFYYKLISTENTPSYGQGLFKGV